MRNNLPQSLDNGCYMYNLDDKNGQGTHWECFVISPPYLCNYDPFGSKMRQYPTREIEALAKRMNLKLITVPYAQQHLKSNLCGYYSLYICDKCKPHVGKLDPNKFKEIVYQAFGPSPDKEDVKKLTNYAKREHIDINNSI